MSDARYFPGTDELHPDRDIVLAENFIDLQIALGVDLSPTDDQIDEIGAAADDDEVLYNYPGDNDFLGSIATSPWAESGASLFFIRFTSFRRFFS